MPVKGVVFPLACQLPSDVRFLLEEFRLVTNEAIRIGIDLKITSRNAISKYAYKPFREVHPDMYSQHVVSSFEVAAGLLKNYRRRLRRNGNAKAPYVRQLMMKAENQAYALDRERGVIDLAIKAGCHVLLRLVVSQYHRRYLDDASLSLGSLTVFLDRVIVTFRKESPKPMTTASVVSLDTNESSLDGVLVSRLEREIHTTKVRFGFPDIPVIQRCHHEKRKRLQVKKSHDRRTSKRLCSREGKRERNRLSYRMHQVANAVVQFAEIKKSAIVIEDLRGMRPAFRSRDLNRRLSLWPRRKLHEFIEYKAAWKGVALVKVDPRYSSRKCPICGRIRDSRMGAISKDFECECGWHLDRHINASLNLLQTAISKGLEVAGGLRFDPGAFQHDVVMTLCEPAMAARSEPNGTSKESAVI